MFGLEHPFLWPWTRIPGQVVDDFVDKDDIANIVVMHCPFFSLSFVT